MSALTPTFDELLKGHDAAPTRRNFSIDEVEAFLKKAYSINSDITSLHTQLLSLRQAYLSTATAPRKTHLARGKGQDAAAAAAASPQQPTVLTDRDRDEIDAQAKSMLRELNASIRILDHEEAQRKAAARAALRQKYGRGLGAALGSWAAGGLGPAKSAEHAAAEEAERQVEAHREGVLWLLRQRLQGVVATQQGMMETRLTREMERNQSVLAKARGAQLPASLASSFSGFGEGSALAPAPAPAHVARPEAHGAAVPGEEPGRAGAGAGHGDLTAEQLQMFEKGNQDMLKYYESTLDKVRTAEKSLVEISELQTMLVNNLAMQSAHIDQLVADSLNTTENVGGGNKQLKKATQRASPARYTFLAASGLCLFLIVWDLVI